MDVRRFAFGVGLLLASTLASGSAQDDDAKELAKARLKVMESAVAGFKVTESGASAAPVFAGKPLLPEYDVITVSDDATGDSTELHNNNMEHFDPPHSQGLCIGGHPDDLVWLWFETHNPVLVSIDEIIDSIKMSGGAGSGQS